MNETRTININVHLNTQWNPILERLCQRISFSCPLTGSTYSRTISQGPCKGHPVVQEIIGKGRRRKELVGSVWIKQRDIKHKNAFPAIGYRINNTVKLLVPFLFDKRGTSDIRRTWSNGQHVDTVDILGLLTKVSGVVYLVVKQNATHLIWNEAFGLNRIIVGVQEIQIDTPFHDCQD